MLKIITQVDKDIAEQEIYAQKEQFNYDTREYPLEVIVKHYQERLFLSANGDPTKTLWTKSTQSKFIESVILGHPLSSVVFAEVNDEHEPDITRLRVVDGNQRIIAIMKFVTGQLTLTGLTRLPLLNGFGFADLLPSRQRKFLRVRLRTIEFNSKTSEEFLAYFYQCFNANTND